MLNHEILQDDRILVVRPSGPLTSEDFETLAPPVDAFIEEHGPLRGLLIEVESFPGWADFGSFVSHTRFVRDHHHQIGKVAAVTDSGFLSIAPKVAGHFVNAEIKHFPYGEGAAAMDWLRDD